MPEVIIQSAQAFALEGEEISNRLIAADALIEKIKRLLTSIVGPLPSRVEFLDFVGKAYEDYVKPLDIPGVPNLIEPRVDAMLRVAVLVAAGKLYDQVAG